jgi:hypothetical protein
MPAVLSKIKKSSICLLFTFLFFSTSLKSQAVYDTLYSFPDTTTFYNETGFWVDDIVNIGITFRPDSSWEYFQLEKIILTVPEGIDTTGWSYLFVSVGILPEDSLIYTKQIFHSELSLFPEANILVLDTPLVINERLKFYLSGSLFYFLSISQDLGYAIPGQFAFWYTPWVWVEYLPYYFNLKVVVKKNLTEVAEQPELLKEFSLSQNYPNPFNPSTKISYQLPVAGIVTLKIYDLLGREVATLVNAEKSAGSYEVEFNSVEALNTTSLPSGIYFYQLRVGDPSTSTGQSFVETKKMILMK